MFLEKKINWIDDFMNAIRVSFQYFIYITNA